MSVRDRSKRAEEATRSFPYRKGCVYGMRKEQRKQHAEEKEQRKRGERACFALQERGEQRKARRKSREQSKAEQSNMQRTGAEQARREQWSKRGERAVEQARRGGTALSLLSEHSKQHACPHKTYAASTSRNLTGIKKKTCILLYQL